MTDARLEDGVGDASPTRHVKPHSHPHPHPRSNQWSGGWLSAPEPDLPHLWPRRSGSLRDRQGHDCWLGLEVLIEAEHGVPVHKRKGMEREEGGEVYIG